MPKLKPEAEELIRARAHDIWEAEGRPEGMAEIHWQRAIESLAAPKAKAPAKPKATKARATKKG